MHVEPGLVGPLKVLAANAAAATVVAWGLRAQLAEALRVNPLQPLKTVLATVFFTLFMQSYHVPVGPSELHFVGAMAMYLTLGFTPTLLGFAAGLLLQGLAFEPGDLVHLGVNSLSLMVPLIGLHYARGRAYFDAARGRHLTWVRIVQLDALYYAGVTLMVGFWLSIGETATPVADWARFAASYLIIVAIEPLVTVAAVFGLKRLDGRPIARLFAVERLTLRA